MDKRTIIAFVVIGLILILYPVYMQLLGVKKNSAPQVTSLPDTVSVAPSRSVSTAAPPVLTEASKAPAFVSAAPPKEEREVKVETPLYTAIFSSRGGNLKSFMLKKYVDYKKDKIDLVKNGPDADNLDLIFPDSNFTLSAINFTPDQPELNLAAKGERKSLSFTYSTKQLVIKKDFVFYPDHYRIDLKVEFSGNTSLLGRKYYLAWNTGLPTTEKNVGEDLSYFATYASLGGELLEYKGPEDENPQDYSKGGKTIWVATRSKYFVASLISPDSSASGFQSRGENLYGVLEGQKVITGKKLSVRLEREVPTQASFSHNYIIHVGPLDYWKLKEYDLQLQNMVNLGWVLFKPFAIGILWFFVHLHKIVANYGVIIIIFTILMKIIFFPLSRKMTRTSLAMAELAPKVNKLKEKLKDDKQKLNQEIFKLYREHKINPLGGCLPLLVQIPIFWAFFVLLRSTIELRQAPFMGWIKDLSLMDPYYILPVLMSVSMFFQQKMTMKDPRQKMLVYIMPAMFFFFFMSFPAGLTLYWTVYNVLSVFEQYVIRSQMQPVATTES